MDFELYNLADDVAESNELSQQRPNVLASMKRDMQEIYTEVQKEAPSWPAWEWPRYESERIQWPDYWLNRKRSGKKPK